jgi:3-oxoacyl-[acyl-carrier protein] reductase
VNPSAKKLDFKNCKVGDSASLYLEITNKFVSDFAQYSGDFNPLHMDEDYASKTNFKRRVVHGMSYGSLVSKLVGMDLPGEGALWTSQSFQFLKPVFLGDQLRLSIEIIQIVNSTRSIRLKALATNQNSDVVMEGTGEVMLLDPVERKEEETVVTKPLVLVTGGSRGIGAAVVRELASKGHPVVFTYHSREQAARQLSEEISATGGTASYLPFQAENNHKAAQKLTDSLLAKYGTPGALVFCGASNHFYGNASDSGWETIQEQIDIHVSSTLKVCQNLIPHMTEKGGGSIVFLGTSYLHGEPPSNVFPYIIAKHALLGMMKAFATEFGPKKIRSNMVSPSMVETELLSNVPQRNIKLSTAQNPLRRLGTPADVAKAVAFLATDESSFINGSEVLITGGSKII